MLRFAPYGGFGIGRREHRFACVCEHSLRRCRIAVLALNNQRPS